MEIHSIESFLPYWENVRARTLRTAGCIPADKLEWTYREGAFTFGDLLRHIVTAERYIFAEPVAGRRSAYQGCGRELADGFDNVIAYMERLHRESVEIFRQLTPEDMRRKCVTPDGASLSTWKWLRAMVEHEIHHRGQIFIYLGMLGVPAPPLYGLTSEQVRERSAASAPAAQAIR